MARSRSAPSLTPTPRQFEVLRARCETGSRKEAAARLGISPETVRWHLARLFERCGCVDEAQAGYRHHEEIVVHVTATSGLYRTRGRRYNGGTAGPGSGSR